MLQAPTLERGERLRQEVAELLPSQVVTEERYALSLDQIRCLGEVALSGVDVDDQILEGARRDFTTSLSEILENESSLRGKFEIADVYDYQTLNGEVMFNTADGPRSLVGMIRAGAAASRLEAQKDPRMQTQALRDEADVFNAERVNHLLSQNTEPNTRLVVSRDLGNAFDNDPDFWQSRGYRKGLAMLQIYYVDNARVTAGTFSVDGVEDSVFDKVLAENGVIVTAGDNNNGVRYGVEKSFSNKQEALRFAENFRLRCYELKGDSQHRVSVNEFINQRQKQIEAAFKSMYLPLSRAVASRQNNPELKQFARSLLVNTTKLSMESTGHLQNIVHDDNFSDEDGRFILGLSLYATTEMLLAQESGVANAIVSPVDLTPAEVLNQLTGYIAMGVEAGRKHGGACAGAFDFGKDSDSDNSNPQGAFGGIEDESGKWEWKKGYCRIPKCPTLPGKTNVGPCAVCRGCQSKFDAGFSLEKIAGMYNRKQINKPEAKDS